MTSIAFLVTGVLVLAWAIAVGHNALSRPRPSKLLARGTDRVLLVLTILLAVAWFITFGQPFMKIEGASGTALAGAIAPQQGSSAISCYAIRPGMTSTAIRSAIGEPDEITKDEDARGPGAEKWSYARAHCKIFLTDGAVDFIE